MKMNRISLLFVMILLTCSCGNRQNQLRQRAAELCQYIPDHQLLERSRDYMTADFYALLDTLFNLPEHEAMDHEWRYYFVTGNGGTIADYEVVSVNQIDASHAEATINVRQRWEDGSFDPATDVEEHQMLMELVEGQWLMADFDGHKADCIRHIAISRREEAVRQAVTDYLVSELGARYLQGQLCVPSLMFVSEEEERVWGDFWIFWYNIEGDTLMTVSGGNHSGCMTLVRQGDAYTVSAFEQTTDGAGFEASAKRIFGPHYELFSEMHANHEVSEAVRREQLADYVRLHKFAVHYYKDYGWPAIAL